MLDIFQDNAFGTLALTDAVNKMPFVPGQAGKAVQWQESGTYVPRVVIEEYQGVLTLINPSARGAPGATVAKQKRTMRDIAIPHYQIDDSIYADEIMGVRAFGQDSQLEVLSDIVNQRMNTLVQNSMDPTLELQRLGAIKGVIVNGDASTLLDLFSAFGVSQATEVDFNLDGATANGDAARLVRVSSARSRKPSVVKPSAASRVLSRRSSSMR